MTRFLGPNANVLLLSTDKKTESNADKMKSLITRFIGQNGKGRVESKCINDLVGCGFKDGSFDMVFVFLKEILVNDKELLVETFRILKLLGILIIYEPLHKTKSGNALTFSGRLSRLILHGFIVKMEENLDEDIGTGPRKLLTDVCEDLSEMREIVGRKPEFEIGSSVPLPFAGKENYIWRIRNTYQDDLIDEDELLDESDKLKPNVSSLKNIKVCATTERRKACKDCSCGLAEELSNDKSEKETPKSSCGNCYLGDAFRCASCPYMGMPAFKPGEKIVLPDSQLDADL